MSDTRHSKSARERTQLFANVQPYAPVTAASRRPDPANPYSGIASSNANPQFADTMYDQLESQHDDQFNLLSSKISMLKDLTTKIGTEVKDGTGLLASLEERFEGAASTVKNTMTRMVRTADQSGVSWRSWLILFTIVIMCFWFVIFI